MRGFFKRGSCPGALFTLEQSRYFLSATNWKPARPFQADYRPLFLSIAFSAGSKVLSTQEIPNDEKRYVFFKEWSKIIAAYSACDLTYAGDKVIALSGVAQDFQMSNNDIYLAGLWRRCLAEQLLWIVGSNSRQINGQPSVRPSIYRAPSWSWLPIDGIIALPAR